MNENELAAARSALEKISHDMKAPLTGILGFTQLLLENETITGSTREYLELIETEARHLNKIMLDGLEEIRARTNDDR